LDANLGRGIEDLAAFFVSLVLSVKVFFSFPRGTETDPLLLNSLLKLESLVAL
jgi:hypothetical protein